MSDRTTSVPSDNATSATPNAESQLPTGHAPAAPGLHELLLAAPTYAAARPEVQALVRQDCLAFATDPAEWPEYLEAVTEWGGTIEELLAESGIEVPAAAPAVVDAAAVAAAAEQAAAEVKAARAAADKLRVKAVAAYRKGDAAYAAGLLECGRLCGEYIAARLAISATQGERKGAVDVLTLELSLEDGTTVDVNRLVRTYHATRLLPAGKAKCQATAYRTYRDYWCRLVERQSGLSGEEYTLLPGLEAECQTAFGKAVADEMTAAGCRAVADVIVTRHGQLLEAAEKQQAAAATEKAKAERAALEEQAAKVREATAAHEKATADAKADASEETAAAVQESADKLLAEQRAVLEAQARVEQADREKAAADKRAKLEAERVAKEAAKVAAKQEKAKAEERKATSAAGCDKCKCEKGVHPQPCKCECHANCGCGNCKPESLTTPGGAQTRGEAVTGNLLRSAKEGAAKDVGDMAAEFLLECEQPDDALEAMLAALVKSGDLSGKARRACEAAMVILARKDTPKAAVSPVEVARMKQPASPAPAEQVNGQVEPAAA